MIADLTRLSIRMAVLAPLSKAFGGGLAALFGGGVRATAPPAPAPRRPG